MYLITHPAVGKTALSWQAEGVKSTELRIGSPTGTLFVRGGSTGQQQTGKWVRDGMVFHLINASNRQRLAAETVGVTTSDCGIQFHAQPNPVVVCDRSGLGQTTISWDAPAVERVEVRVGSPQGTLFVSGGSSGSQRTGKWVRDGMVFYLLNASNRRTLATFRVDVFVPPGCK